MAITKIHARYVYDSCCHPTVEVDVITESGFTVLSFPLALPLPKVDEVLINLRGTPNKGKLGANAILGVSLAVAKAAAAERQIPLYAHISDLASTMKPYVLPVPFMNVLGDPTLARRLAFREFLIVASAAPSFSRLSAKALNIANLAGDVGEEGDVAPNIQRAEEALKLITKTIKSTSYTSKIYIAIRVASSKFYKEEAKKYDLDFKSPDSDLTTSTRPSDFQIVSDDLIVTNPLRIKKAIDLKSCNVLLLKVNQIGTLTESIQAVKDSAAGWGVMVSHRSGETEDVTVADIVIGLRAGQIKTGASARFERLAKLNQILRIDEELGAQVVYAGEIFK
ncbi:hypothetical protein OIDMADRAFT_104104 [Oidiodendron maius Zn]|uniref:Enolase n=1 Tax=Oidiodendron maius (strain Zn) TaxID=913774 RepID=A0A0C3HCU3_OIDMZ|nr:hypothetical protein OIDMADRAFT_104104 [Oidiodendron maius Zn]